ncbi:MAG: hypothetical protein LWW83_01035 [Azonexaceae bacterium]|nr:hypothetical protein [Azonexaceae bacterium]
MLHRDLSLPTAHGPLYGRLALPNGAGKLLLIARAHRRPDDEVLADALVGHGIAVLDMNLLSSHELQFADATQNVPRLSERLLDVLELIRIDGDLERLPLTVLAHGDSTPAAIRAAARRDAQVDALICHGGLADRAGLQSLQLLTAPLLMLFEHDDDSGPPAWERASRHLGGPHAMHRLAAGESPLAVMLQWLKTRGTG